MKQSDRKNHENQAGGVIIWIFVLIALFAALAFVVNDGSRNSSANMSEYEIDLAATEIIDYARNVKNTIQELRINGCDDNEISFENDVVTSGLTNPNSPTDESCHVFQPNGGGLTFDLAHDRQTDNEQAYNFFLANMTDIGSTENDVVMYKSHIKNAVCDKINDTLSNSITASSVSAEDVSSVTFEGDFNAAGVETHGNLPADSDMAGILEGCITESTGCGTGACLIYYKVVMVR